MDQRLWRALLHGDTFIVLDAGFIDDEPIIAYHFDYFPDDPNGSLGKWWLDEDGTPIIESYPLGDYPDEETFRADVQVILDEAWQTCQSENLDYLLAVIDLVKQRAVDAGLDDDTIFEAGGCLHVAPV